MFETPYDPLFLQSLLAPRRPTLRQLTHGEKVPTDPHWKRVAKDRAKRKAVKKHKQHMRRSGKST